MTLISTNISKLQNAQGNIIDHVLEIVKAQSATLIVLRTATDLTDRVKVLESAHHKQVGAMDEAPPTSSEEITAQKKI
jgi:hypothetical protein